MITNDLDLGFAKIRATVNNTAINFEVGKSSFDTYQLDDGTELHPAGCLEIKLNNSDYLQKARKYGHFTGYKN